MNRRNRTLDRSARRRRRWQASRPISSIAPSAGSPFDRSRSPRFTWRSRPRTCRLGTRLTKEHIKLVGWPSSSPVQGSFASPDRARRARADPVRARERAADRDQAGARSRRAPVLPPSIPPGMRALSVRVNDVIGVAGFTVPGTRVDVLVTINRGRVEHVARGREQRAGADGRHALRPGSIEGRQGHSVDGRHADADAGRRRADHARAACRVHHAHAPQSARRRSDRHQGRANGEPDGDAPTRRRS